MSNFLVCTNAILPLVITMGLGYFFKRINLLPQQIVPTLNSFCVFVLLPSMLFNNAYNANFRTDFEPGAIIFMISALLICVVLACIIVPKIVKKQENISTIIQCICHGNTAILGLPVMQNLYGADNIAAYSILVAFFTPIMNPAMITQRLMFQKKDAKAGEIIKGALTTPMLLAPVAGIILNLLNIPLPTIVTTTVTWLKNASTPMSLLALGASFTIDNIREDIRPVAITVLTRCILVPALLLGTAVALGFRGQLLTSLLIIFASPCSVSTYSFCQKFAGNGRLGSRLVFVCTSFSMLSIFGWIFLCLQTGLI